MKQGDGIFPLNSNLIEKKKIVDQSNRVQSAKSTGTSNVYLTQHDMSTTYRTRVYMINNWACKRIRE